MSKKFILCPSPPLRSQAHSEEPPPRSLRQVEAYCKDKIETLLSPSNSRNDRQMCAEHSASKQGDLKMKTHRLSRWVAYFRFLLLLFFSIGFILLDSAALEGEFGLALYAELIPKYCKDLKRDWQKEDIECAVI